MSDYSNGLFGCCRNTTTCLYGAFCPFCLNAMNWAEVQNETCSIRHCLCPMNPFWVRQIIRKRKNLEEHCCFDAISFGFCMECAVCADTYEIQDGLPAAEKEAYAA